MAYRCKYLSKADADDLDDRYDKILGQLVTVISSHDKWKI